MKRTLSFLASLAPSALHAAPALPVPVLNLSHIHCDEAQDRVIEAKVIELNTAKSSRYVSARRYCGEREQAEVAFVATSDSDRCLIGWRCVNPESGE